MTWVWVSIGSNIEREHNTRAAIAALRSAFGELVLSPVYETQAVGFDGAPFYNLAAGFDTRLSAENTSSILKEIETNNGRKLQDAKFSSRTLDIDLLTYGDTILDKEGLHIPRDEILKYAFVLKPLADVAPNDTHPVAGKSYADLWQEFNGDRQLSEIPFKWD